MASEEEVLSDTAKNNLTEFLAKVDEIGDLVKGLSNSQDKATADEAIKKADVYLHRIKTQSSNTGFSRTIVNTHTTDTTVKPSEVSQQEFCASLEEDAQERAERRREKEAAGREWKRKGTQAFRQGNVGEAVQCYTYAIEETPWVVTLYTNRALCYNKLSRYKEAIEDCDKAIRIEPATVRAHVHKGKALFATGNYSQAIECYQEALKLDPDTGLKTEIQSALDSAQQTLANS